MADQSAAKPAGVWPTVKPFVNGGASGMLATCVIETIDMIKILCLHGSPDRPEQYVTVMNSIYSAQRSMVLGLASI